MKSILKLLLHLIFALIVLSIMAIGIFLGLASLPFAALAAAYDRVFVARRA